MTDSPYPALVISLDLELHWGVGARVSGPEHPYWRNIKGARLAAERILDLFQQRDIHATWATVGFLFARSLQELAQFWPACLPVYHRRACNNYRLSTGKDEEEDPLHFAGSLVRRIRAAKGQELASHSFSHYFCNELGQGPEAFTADLEAAQRIAETAGGRMRSFVFPRNQINTAYLPILKGAGFSVYRGNPPLSGVPARPALRSHALSYRAKRFLDRYWNLTGHGTYPWSEIMQEPLRNVRASRFLRPYSHRFRLLEPLRIRRMLKSMQTAVRQNEIYHLWWHPHNFGRQLEANMSGLERLLDGFAVLRDEYGMQSLTMAEVADEAERLLQRK